VWQSLDVLPSGDLLFNPNERLLEDTGLSILFAKVLFVGDPEPQTTKWAVDAGLDTRHYMPNRMSRMPKGTTIFQDHNGDWVAVICSDGRTDIAAIGEGRQDFLPDDHPLIGLTLEFSAYWERGSVLPTDRNSNMM